MRFESRWSFDSGRIRQLPQVKLDVRALGTLAREPVNFVGNATPGRPFLVGVGSVQATLDRAIESIAAGKRLLSEDNLLPFIRLVSDRS
jgi:hypothetical protein